MRAVIYARYSSENQREASIEDQVRQCRAFIEQQGWSYRHAYTDRRQSGASSLRAGYQKLLEDAREDVFDVVVAEALDRLSRDQEDVAGLYKRLCFCGVKIVTLAEGEISDLHVGLKGTMNALYLKDLARKTRRGLEGRVRQGKSGGGLCYGYDALHEVDAAGDPVRGGRRINEAEAAVVVRIFSDYAAGESPRAIAKMLNAEGNSGPSGKPWGASTIHGNWRRGTGILNNELYIGRLVWNRQHFIKDPETGKRIARLNPESDWIVTEVPELRIVDDDLWRRVKERQGAHQAKIKRSETGYLLNGTHRQRYLLSGLLKCGVCGGGYTITGVDRYGCANRRNRGTCSNSLTIKRQELEERVLAGLKEKLLTPEMAKVFVAEFQSEMNRLYREREAGLGAAQAELREIGHKIEAILKALEDGIYTPSTKGRLLTLEARKKELEQQLDSAPGPVPRLHPNLAKIYRQKVENLQEALNQPETRLEASEALRGLIEAIGLTPEIKGQKQELKIELYGELAAIMRLGQKKNRTSGAEVRFSLVAGAGFEPATFRL